MDTSECRDGIGGEVKFAGQPPAAAAFDSLET
jgi:hypothetical protein